MKTWLYLMCIYWSDMTQEILFLKGMPPMSLKSLRSSETERKAITMYKVEIEKLKQIKSKNY